MFSFDYVVNFLLVVANKLDKMAIGYVCFHSKFHQTKYFIVSFQNSPLLNVKISMVTQTPSLFVAACKKQFSTAQRSHGQVSRTIWKIIPSFWKVMFSHLCYQNHRI